MAPKYEILRKELVKLVPASLINDIACFVLYDNHPRDQRNIDIVVCTNYGEIIEFYQRNRLFLVNLYSKSPPGQLELLRNSTGKLFYVILAGDEFYILKRDEALTLYRTVNDVSSYEITDEKCLGFPHLKVYLKSDALPLIYNDNLECLPEHENFNVSINEDSSPIVLQLQRKLREANYGVKCNEQALSELISLRQKVGFSQYQKQCPNLKDTLFTSVEQVASALKIKTQVPWVKSCNKKVVIIFNLRNENNVFLEEVNILLTNSSESLVYATKIFEKVKTPPFWTESLKQRINPDKESAIVSVINIEDLKNTVLSTIEFKGTIYYKKGAKEFFLPFDNVVLTSLYTMAQEFDVLHSKQYDENNMLAILATTERLDLFIKSMVDDPQFIDLQEKFCTHLQMELIFSNIVIHRKSPYHILNGLMIVFQNNENLVSTEPSLITVYARSSSQILALLHHINDSIPFRIVARIANYEITEDHDSIMSNNEIHDTDGVKTCYSMNKIGMVLEYIKSYMSDINSTEIQSKIFSESSNSMMFVD